MLEAKRQQPWRVFDSNFWFRFFTMKLPNWCGLCEKLGLLLLPRLELELGL